MLAKVFEDLVVQSKNFDLVCDRQLSLVCFRYTGGNELGEGRDDQLNLFNEKLTSEMTKDTTMGFIVGGKVAGIIYQRFVTGSHTTAEGNVIEFYKYMSEIVSRLEE